jgi:hypothetical protein
MRYACVRARARARAEATRRRGDIVGVPTIDEP